MVYTVQYSFKAFFQFKKQQGQATCASPGKRIFSSILCFGPQSYNSEKSFCRENQSKDEMYICAVGRMCVHLWFYHVWICLQSNSFHFHSSESCSVLLQSPPSKNPVTVDLSFYSRWWSVHAFLYICCGQAAGEASLST